MLLALALDFLFIASFGALATVILRRADGVWALPLTALALDIVEGVLVILFLSSPPGLSEVGWLRIIAIVKLVAYGGSVIAIVWAAVRSAVAPRMGPTD